MGIAGARGQRQSSDYYLVTPTIELQLTQNDRPPRLAPSRPRTSGVVSLWMSCRRVCGGVSTRLPCLVLVSFESRPQPSCHRSVAPAVEGCLKNSCPLVQIFRRAHHVVAGRLDVRTRRLPDMLTPAAARSGRLKRRCESELLRTWSVFQRQKIGTMTLQDGCEL